MRCCSSAPTTSRRAGARYSLFSTPGPTIRRGIFRITSLVAMVPPQPTSCWRVMAALGVRWIEDHEDVMADKREISLVLADVDGTLVNERKVLTKRALAAVQHLREAGIRFAITSGRPPRG